jgi:hypothetical protein
MKPAWMMAAATMLAACSATGPGPGAGGSFFTGGNVTAIANIAVPGGCTTAAPVMSSNLTAVCRGVDLAALMLTTSSKPEFNYLETDQFDLQMHASMNGSVPSIKSPVPANDKLTIAELEASTTPRPDSPRLAFWLAKIRSTGGQNLICQEGAKGAENAFAWMLANMATDWLKDWLTYKPAANYHAKVFVKPMTGGKDYEVVRTEFVLRSREPAPECPA